MASQYYAQGSSGLKALLEYHVLMGHVHENE
jgi:hypothetical protein